MNILAKASNWLERTRTRHATSPVRYLRGEESVEVPASIGKTVFRLDREYGVTERIESRDYLILVEDLVLDGTRTIPRSGDRIQEVDGDKLHLYEVMAPGGEPHYRFSDSYRLTYRIHTKFLRTEDAP